MANLCAGICSSLMKVRKAQDTDGFRPASHGAPGLGERWQRSPGISGSVPLESVAGLPWNQWQRSCGIAGSFAVESVAGLAWNTQFILTSRSSWKPEFPFDQRVALQFLRNFYHLTAFEQAEMILYAALDPAIASQARRGDFVQCFDHFDLLQSSIN